MVAHLWKLRPLGKAGGGPNPNPNPNPIPNPNPNPNPINPNPNPTPNPNQVHGFAASCEQWERLAYALRQQASPQELPPVWAVDMLGFGHTEKPGLSYTQHLWEAQVAD